MEEVLTLSTSTNLEKYGLNNVKEKWNLTPQELQKMTIEKKIGRETPNGMLARNIGSSAGPYGVGAHIKLKYT